MPKSGQKLAGIRAMGLRSSRHQIKRGTQKLCSTRRPGRRRSGRSRSRPGWPACAALTSPASRSAASADKPERGGPRPRIFHSDVGAHTLKKRVKKRCKRGTISLIQAKGNLKQLHIRDKDLLARSELCECFCDGLQNRQITHRLGYNMLVFSDVHSVRSNPVPIRCRLRRRFEGRKCTLLSQNRAFFPPSSRKS